MVKDCLHLCFAHFTVGLDKEGKDFMKEIKYYVKECHIFVVLYRVVHKILINFYWYFKLLYLKRKPDTIYAYCFVFTTFNGKIKHNNWGDDINKFFFEEVIDKKIEFVPFDKLWFKPNVYRYSLIGSIVGDFNLDDTIIFGSGSISDNPIIEGTPKSIISVRGPLTRKVLLDKGIDCPQKYGDPVLLLPLFYSPNVEKKYKIGVIPHYRTENNQVVNKLIEDENNLFIDMSSYNDWKEIIDQITSCEMIISESLHGLIVSETYGIPCVWVEFNKHNYEWNWEFKFLDFFYSINKRDVSCINFYEMESFEKVIEAANKWKPGNIKYKELLDIFPFQYSNEKLISTYLLRD